MIKTDAIIIGAGPVGLFTVHQLGIKGLKAEVIDHNNKKFLIIGVGINTNFSPIIKKFKSTSLNNMGKKNINNNQILKDIKKVYEKFIHDIKKYTFLDLKRKLVKSK